ncbi:MAG: undecaprenyl-diphosphate phosphatase [Ruminococcaceae bacterium]|nr:undecaprenyl-diphosphate phosphatase [Oscillospiraceae bacterium]
MDWNGLFGMVYGVLGGLFSFLPVSPEVHQEVFLRLAGLSAPGYGMSLAVHLGGLLAVIFSYYKQILRFATERKIAALPVRRRKRQPDAVCLMELKLLRLSAIALALFGVLAPWLGRYFNRLWLLAIIAVLNAVLVYVPHYMPRANKDARSVTPLDALLVGFSGIVCMVPGFSAVGALTAVSSMRGQDREFGLRYTYLLMIPLLVCMCIGDLIMLIATSGGNLAAMLLPGILACLGAFGAGIMGIRMMRFLSVKIGYESFAYYSLGLAMFTFVIYLI